MTAMTRIKPRGIDTTGDYVVNSISSTGNVSAGNIKTDHLLYSNGTAYVFTTNAAGANTQVQFNDGNSFAGDANLTFNKTTGTLTVAHISSDGANISNVNALTLNGHSDTYFATSTQGNLADTSVQPGDLATVATTGNYSDLNNKPTLFDGEYASLANKPTLFSGSYADLSNKPTLGTAASTNANAYATAAQGSLADTAIQSGANISVFTNDSGYLVAANLSTYATQSYVGNAIANLVASAPATLDTLNELANALGNDASYSTTITNALANKLSTSAFASTANTWISTQTTSNLAEGTNQYYTVARANTAIDNRVTKTFIDNLAVVANIANISYSVDGANVTGIVGNATHANLSDSANSVAGANVTGQVGNALIAGTVYTNAQPNITSLGTLTSLTITGNITSGNATLGNLTTSNYFSGNGSLLTSITGANITGFVPNANVSNTAYSVAVANVTGIGNIATINKDGNASNILYGNGVFASAPITYSDSNVGVYLPNYSGNLSPGNISIGVANLHISGGNANYVLKTDGAGNLSWTAQSGAGEYTAVTIDNFTGDGTTTQFTLSVTPANKNQTFVNYNGAAQLRSSYSVAGATITFSEAPANGSSIEVTSTIGIASANGDLLVRTYTGDNSTVNFTVSSGTSATNMLVTQNGLLQTPTTDYTVSAGTLTFVTAPTTGEKIQIRELTTAIATVTSLAGANITGQVGNALVAGTVYTNAQPNVTSVGSLTGLTVTGNVALSGANVSLGAVGNLKVTGGSNGQYIKTDGSGNLSFGTVPEPLNPFLLAGM